MHKYGVRFQPSLTGTLHLSRTNAFFLGGGRALLNAYYAAADTMGIDVVYDAEATSVKLRDDGKFESATVRHADADHEVRAKVMVAAAGGFEANIEWLKEAWGAPAENFLIRGTPYNRGVLLKNLLAQGVKAIGDPKQCHAVAIDARSPKFDGGICTRVGLRFTRHRRQSGRPALLRRRRRFLAEALCDLGPARRLAGRPDRLLDHRFEGARQVHAAGLSAD